MIYMTSLNFRRFTSKFQTLILSNDLKRLLLNIFSIQVTMALNITLLQSQLTLSEEVCVLKTCTFVTIKNP